jgi:glycosyltransferase involved in cell wall biosynthesis
MPRITVVIPVFNSARTVEETIDSALAQTFGDFEIVAVDDGSTDTSAAVLAQYASRIRIVSQPNRGLSAARNAGVKAGQGELLAFLDADDAWQPDYLARMADALDKDPGCVLAYADLRIVDSEGRELSAAIEDARIGRPPELREMFERLWPIMPSAVVMRRAAFERIGGFPEQFRGLGYEDVYMWMRARELGRFAYVAEPLVRWRFSLFPEPLKRGGKEREAAALFLGMVRERWGVDADALVRARERAPRSILGYIGLRALGDGDRTTARRAFARALRYDPLRVKNYLRYARTFLPAPMARALSGRSRTER